MVMADPSFSSLLVTIVGTLAKEHGWQYFEKLRANDIMLVQGNQQVSDMVKRGERVIAVGADAAYVGESQEGRHADLDALPGRRHVHHSLAELGGEGLAQSERRQGVRRVHAEPGRCRSCSRRSISIRRAPTSPGPDGIRRSADQDARRSTTTTSRPRARASSGASPRRCSSGGRYCTLSPCGRGLLIGSMKKGTTMRAAYAMRLDVHNHGISDAWITSGTPLPPTERMARSTSLSPNLCVVIISSGKRLEASCSSASSQAL